MIKYLISFVILIFLLSCTQMQDDEISESLAVEHKVSDDTEVIIFVVMNKKYQLTDKIKDKIKFNLKNSLSPKYVPKKIFSVYEIPKTRSGKIVELMVKKIINGENITNTEMLINPHCLREYEDICNLIN